MAGNLAKIGKVLGQLSTTSTKVCAPAVVTQNRNCKYLLLLHDAFVIVECISLVVTYCREGRRFSRTGSLVY